MAKKHKMDRYTIAAKKDYELDYVVESFRKEGLKVSRDDVREAIERLNSHSRRKVYKFLRDEHPAESHPTDHGA